MLLKPNMLIGTRILTTEQMKKLEHMGFILRWLAYYGDRTSIVEVYVTRGGK